MFDYLHVFTCVCLCNRQNGQLSQLASLLVVIAAAEALQGPSPPHTHKASITAPHTQSRGLTSLLVVIAAAKELQGPGLPGVVPEQVGEEAHLLQLRCNGGACDWMCV